MTGPERPPERHDDLRYPDPKPFRRIQVATVALIVLVAVLTLTSGSRPAEVRWGTLIGLAALTVLVPGHVATPRAPAFAPRPKHPKCTRNRGERRPRGVSAGSRAFRHKPG